LKFTSYTNKNKNILSYRFAIYSERMSDHKRIIKYKLTIKKNHFVKEGSRKVGR